MSDILGVVSTLPDTEDDFDFSEYYCYLKKSNMPFGCAGCSSENESATCESPFKKYFGENFEKMKARV